MDDDTWESERGCSRLFGRGRVAQGAFIGESLLYHEVPRKHIVGWCLVGGGARLGFSIFPEF